ncbi:MAG: hypothetical protein ACKVPJ_11615 [Chitinophagales bacterium]
MTKGIIKITPKPGMAGQVQMTSVDPNRFGVVVGSVLSCSDPGFTTKQNQVVDCDITSSTTCSILVAQVSG